MLLLEVVLLPLQRAVPAFDVGVVPFEVFVPALQRLVLALQDLVVPFLADAQQVVLDTLVSQRAQGTHRRDLEARDPTQNGIPGFRRQQQLCDVGTV